MLKEKVDLALWFKHKTSVLQAPAQAYKNSVQELSI